MLTHDHSVSVSDFANWSRPAVVCDPLYDPPGTRVFWRRGIRACFRCETVTSSWFQRRPRKMQDNARVARNAHRSGLSDYRRHFNDVIQARHFAEADDVPSYSVDR